MAYSFLSLAKDVLEKENIPLSVIVEKEAV